MQTRLLIALCLLSASSFSQEIMDPTGPDAYYAPCLDGQKGSRYYESEVLTSPDGYWLARASVEAQAGGEFGCSDVSTLLVRRPGESDYQPVFVQKPEPDALGNGLRLVAWSPHGHLIAVEMWWWQFASDFAGMSPLIYDADRRQISKPDLAKLFAKKSGKKECAFNTSKVVGFDSQNRLLFEADDWIEPGDEEPLPETRCLGSPGLWALDLGRNQLELVKHIEEHQ